MYKIYLYTNGMGWGNIHEYAYIADADSAAYLDRHQCFSGAPEKGYYENLTARLDTFGTIEEAEEVLLKNYPHARHARSLEDNLCTGAPAIWYLHGPFIAGYPC